MEENNITTAENTEQVADVQESLIVDNDVQTEVEETQETPIGAENTKQEDVSTTKAFSKRLNEKMAEAEEKIRADVAKEYEGYKGLLGALEGLGFKGTPEEIAMRIQAEQKGMDYDEYAAQEKAKQTQIEEMVENHEDVQLARKMAQEYQFRSDLDSIKKVFPEVDIEAIEFKDGKCNLGEAYADLMLTGKYSAVEAYTLQKQFDALTKKEPPKSMGDVKSGSVEVEKEIKTEEDFKKFVARNPDWDKDEKLVEEITKRSLTW